MMAYQNGFVASVIVNGKPVREVRGDCGVRTCHVPFGTDYALRLRNNSENTALVSVDIDGTPVTTQGRLVVHPSDYVDLERFMDSNRKFRFVRASHSDVQDPSSPDNGIIRIMFMPVQKKYWVDKSVRRSVLRGDVGGMTMDSLPMAQAYSTQCCPTPCCAAPGATVEGGISSQEFTEDRAEYFPSGPLTMITLQLLGPVQKTWTGNCPWRVDGGRVFYEGKPLHGYSSVTCNTDGAIIIRVDPTGP